MFSEIILIIRVKHDFLYQKGKTENKETILFFMVFKEYSEVNKIFNDNLFIIPMSAWEI